MTVVYGHNAGHHGLPFGGGQRPAKPTAKQSPARLGSAEGEVAGLSLVFDGTVLGQHLAREALMVDELLEVGHCPTSQALKYTKPPALCGKERGLST